VEPLSPDRYKVQFTASRAFKDKIERLRALVPPAEGDLVALLESALDEKLARLEARRFARTKAPPPRLDEASSAPRTRHIRAAVRREVHERDQGRCRFLDAQGRRGSERRWLELHHRYPFGRGGGHSPDNVALLCGAHHALVTESDWGRP
jgi:hypothetical protein